MKRKRSSTKRSSFKPKRRKIDKYFGRAVTNKDTFHVPECNSKECSCFGINANFGEILNPVEYGKLNDEKCAGIYVRPFINHELSRCLIDNVLNIHIWAQYWVGARSLYVFPKNFIDETKTIPRGGWCVGSARSLSPPAHSRVSNNHVDCVLKWTMTLKKEKWTLVVGQVPKTKDKQMSSLAFVPLGGWIQLAALAWELPGATLPETVVTASEIYMDK